MEEPSGKPLSFEEKEKVRGCGEGDSDLCPLPRDRRPLACRLRSAASRRPGSERVEERCARLVAFKDTFFILFFAARMHKYKM